MVVKQNKKKTFNAWITYQALYAHFTKDVMEKLEVAAKKEFSYGSSE